MYISDWLSICLSLTMLNKHKYFVNLEKFNLYNNNRCQPRLCYSINAGYFNIFLLSLANYLTPTKNASALLQLKIQPVCWFFSLIFLPRFYHVLNLISYYATFSWRGFCFLYACLSVVPAGKCVKNLKTVASQTHNKIFFSQSNDATHVSSPTDARLTSGGFFNSVELEKKYMKK